MPLDARKTQHIQQVITRSFAGRQRIVVLVSLLSGSYTYTLLQAILRPLKIVDPQVLDARGVALPHSADTLLIAPAGTNFAGVVYIADTMTASTAAVAASAKYEIIEVLPIGIIPGGSHLRATLRRLR